MALAEYHSVVDLTWQRQISRKFDHQLEVDRGEGHEDRRNAAAPHAGMGLVCHIQLAGVGFLLGSGLFCCVTSQQLQTLPDRVLAL
jgi:hypothetical protein